MSAGVETLPFGGPPPHNLSEAGFAQRGSRPFQGPMLTAFSPEVRVRARWSGKPPVKAADSWGLWRPSASVDPAHPERTVRPASSLTPRVWVGMAGPPLGSSGGTLAAVPPPAPCPSSSWTWPCQRWKWIRLRL